VDEAPQIADIQRGYIILFCFVNVLETYSQTVSPPVCPFIRPENEEYPKHCQYRLEGAFSKIGLSKTSGGKSLSTTDHPLRGFYYRRPFARQHRPYQSGAT